VARPLRGNAFASDDIASGILPFPAYDMSLGEMDHADEKEDDLDLSSAVKVPNRLAFSAVRGLVQGDRSVPDSSGFLEVPQAASRRDRWTFSCDTKCTPPTINTTHRQYQHSLALASPLMHTASPLKHLRITN